MLLRSADQLRLLELLHSRLYEIVESDEDFASSEVEPLPVESTRWLIEQSTASLSPLRILSVLVLADLYDWNVATAAGLKGRILALALGKEASKVCCSRALNLFVRSA